MGWRFVAEEALSGGIVQKICDIEDLINTAVHMGQAVIGQNIFKRATIKHLKSDLYGDIIDAFQSKTISRQGVLQAIAQFDRKSKLWQSRFWARLWALFLFLKNCEEERKASVCFEEKRDCSWSTVFLSQTIMVFHSNFSWTFLTKGERCNEVIPMWSTNPTAWDKARPQHRKLRALLFSIGLCVL